MKVLIIVGRGLRMDYLGCYGRPWMETPALDALAATGIVFDQHFADAADPDGARRAWRCGRYLFPGVETTSGNTDLLALLKAHGVTTSLVVDASRPLSPEFAQGWQSIENAVSDGDETPLERTIAVAQSRLRKLKDRENWLLWVDLATLLPPWNVPTEFAEHYFREKPIEEDEDDEMEDVEVEPLTPLPDPPLGATDIEDDTLFLRIQGSYAAAVTYFDAGLAELLRGIDDDVLVLVTSDVGFALGEHGFVGSGLSWPSESVTHLPLIVRPPGGGEAGRVSTLTQAVDLAPTLAGLFGVSFPEPRQVHGHDLAPLLHGEMRTLRPYIASGLNVGSTTGLALRTPEWSFVLSASETGDAVSHLYIRPDDPGEVNDIRQHYLELTEAMERTLHDFVNATQRPGPLDVPPLSEASLPREVS